MNKTCAVCRAAALQEAFYSEKTAYGRRRPSVDGLRKTVCTECGHEFVTLDQHDLNQQQIERASAEVQFAVFPGLIRDIREMWGMTQRQAAKLFGAGDGSVAKWESGRPPSGPAALLLQCAANVPGTVEYLAKLASVPVSRQTVRTYDWNEAFEVLDVRLPATPFSACNQPYYFRKEMSYNVSVNTDELQLAAA